MPHSLYATDTDLSAENLLRLPAEFGCPPYRAPHHSASAVGYVTGLQFLPMVLLGPLGGALAPGFYANVFGDANALVKKDVFAALGGFSEERDLGFEDWEFFARAVLKGYRLLVVPEPLFDI